MREFASRTTPALWAALDRHRRPLVNLARHWGMPVEQAEDAASETIVRAATYRYLDESRIEQFLATVMRRVMVDDVRRQIGRRRLLTTSEQEVAGEGDMQQQNVVESMTVVSMLAEARLSRTERTVVALRMDGYSHADISARLSISPHASELALARARHKLRPVVTC